MNESESETGLLPFPSPFRGRALEGRVHVGIHRILRAALHMRLVRFGELAAAYHLYQGKVVEGDV